MASIRKRMPHVQIIVRGDSGFAREAIMAARPPTDPLYSLPPPRWCEAQESVYYCIGLARNARLEAMLSPAQMAAQMAAQAQHCLCGGANVRRFAELTYRTLDSWSRDSGSRPGRRW